MELKEQLVRREYAFSADEIASLLHLSGKVVFASYEPEPHSMNPNTFVIKTEEGVTKRAVLREEVASTIMPISPISDIKDGVGERGFCEIHSELSTPEIVRVEPTKIVEVSKHVEPEVAFVREIQPPVLARDYEASEGLEIIEVTEKGLIDED